MCVEKTIKYQYAVNILSRIVIHCDYYTRYMDKISSTSLFSHKYIHLIINVITV